LGAIFLSFLGRQGKPCQVGDIVYINLDRGHRSGMADCYRAKRRSLLVKLAFD
jgi:hypothetical protein